MYMVIYVYMKDIYMYLKYINKLIYSVLVI